MTHSVRPDYLPQISWVLVPERDPRSGRREFIYGKNERRIEPDFWIARYPLTNAQFYGFLVAPDGFYNPSWWEGLSASTQHRNDWKDRKNIHWNHPRVNVSWYDAMAFCRWLSAKAVNQPDLLPQTLDRDKEWHITLPTEWQWEKAARGHSGRNFPWGNYYKEGHANVNETVRDLHVGEHNLRSTTAVGIYPHDEPHDSPYGIADLSGNVWEWCRNEYDNPDNLQDGGTDSRAMRGGCWSYSFNQAAASFRGPSFPHERDQYGGFRIVVVGYVHVT